MCLSPRSWSVMFAHGTRDSACVPMSAIYAAVGHFVTLINLSRMSFWIKHTCRAMCSVVLVNNSRLELRKIYVESKFTRPHNITTATGQRHELGFSSAQSNHLREGSMPWKGCTVDEQIVSNWTAPINFVACQDGVDKGQDFAWDMTQRYPLATPRELPFLDANKIPQHLFSTCVKQIMEQLSWGTVLMAM